jgi:MSHA pilin protein MshA
MATRPGCLQGIAEEAGFSLIELVMVIVILGILAGVAIPRFLTLRDEARNAKADGSIGAMRTAVSSYYSETAATLSSGATFPASMTTAMFADATMPTFDSPYTYSYNSSTGVVLKQTNG